MRIRSALLAISLTILGHTAAAWAQAPGVSAMRAFLATDF
jgi:hypothetical protein